MKEEEKPRPWEGWISPRPLFCGIILAFAFCCWSGIQSAKEGCFRRFTRFHQRIIPESMFFPTVSQSRQFVFHHVSRKKILVIVGGNSVFQGTGQKVEEVWTRKLQEVLGDEYRVVNFGFRAGSLQEYGLTIAESLAGTYKKLIFTAIVPQRGYSEPDGYFFKYFHWDAHYKGLLLPHPGRDKAFNLLPDKPARPTGMGSSPRVELRRAGWLDSKFYFNDLWNSLAYTTISTPWNSIAAVEKPFYTPRQLFADNDPGAPPLETRYTGPYYELQIKVLHKMVHMGYAQDKDGHWHRDKEYWKEFRHALDICIPEGLRQKSLLVAQRYSPHFTAMLSREDQGLVDDGIAATMAQVRALGMRAMDPGMNVTAADFMDLGHRSSSGGAQLAESMAPVIRQMAQELGYLP